MVTITRDITQWTDDAEIYDFFDLTYNVADPTLTADVYLWDADLIVGRFQNVNIPQWTTITNATLSFTSSTTKSIQYQDNPVLPINCTGFEIWYIDDDNISTFSDWWSINARSTPYIRTTSNSVVTDTEYTTPDISSLIQDIVDRVWRVSWNALALRISPYPRWGYSNTWLNVYAYDWDPTKVMSLEITYLLPWWTISNVTSMSNISSLTF